MRGHLHNLEEHRSRKKPKLRTQRKRDPVKSPLRPMSTEPHPVSRSETITMRSQGTALQFTFWTNSVASWGWGIHCRVQGKSFWGLLRSYYLECLGDEQKVERVSNVGDTGRNISGKWSDN